MFSEIIKKLALTKVILSISYFFSQKTDLYTYDLRIYKDLRKHFNIMKVNIVK